MKLDNLSKTGVPPATASESAGRQIQNNKNLIIKIPQAYKCFTPF
jgi:hypothetical protein